MILAEKIALLRKMNGMSQEELAEKLNVSRQSISKWESAQSMPDLKRILMMAELFGISTDVLLKDKEDLTEHLPQPAYEENGATPDRLAGDAVPALRHVSMEEANEYLGMNTIAGGRIAVGVMLCILSPVTLILMAEAQEAGLLRLTENQTAGIGILILMLMIGCAVGLFIYYGMKLERFEYIQKEPIETAYGVSGMVSERLRKYQPVHIRFMVIGIMLCVLSCIPLFISLIMGGAEFPTTVAVGALLVMVAMGVLLIVRTSIIHEGLQGLLEEGDFSRENKLEKRRNETIMGIYWTAAIVIYLLVSFLTERWDRTWIIWPVAGLGGAVLEAVLRTIRTRE